MAMIINIFSFIVAALLVYFLFPNILRLSADLGEFVCEWFADLKTAFKDKAEEWKDLFSFFVGGDEK